MARTICSTVSYDLSEGPLKMYVPTVLAGVTYEHSLFGACVTACTKTAGVKIDYVMHFTN